MNDIQTEMIMNSDSSNIVNDILKELNNPQSSPATTKHEPIHLQMRERAQHIQPNSTLNENAVINQYDNKDISNEIHLSRQMDPHMNLNPNVRLDMKNQANMEKLRKNNVTKNTKTGFTKKMLIQIIKMVKNIVILFVILLLFLSPIANKLSVRFLPKLFSSSSSQVFKWIGLTIKALLISVLYNVIYLFV